MINNFRNFIEFSDCVAANGAIFVPESCCGWAKQYHQSMPQIDLNLPTIEKKARIEILHNKNNPIFIQLSDGSKLFFSYDEFKRIQGEPQQGKMLHVVMQRLPNDVSPIPSKIVHCKVT